jgi:hypothetical protein
VIEEIFWLMHGEEVCGEVVGDTPVDIRNKK